MGRNCQGQEWVTGSFSLIHRPLGSCTHCVTGDAAGIGPRAGMHVLLVKQLIRQLLNSHHPSASAAQLLTQRVGLGRGQSQPVALGDGDDRRLVRVIVRFDQAGRKVPGHRAQRRERG
jgi:hypothetical protein